MPDATDLTDVIASEAALPLKSESDGQSAEGHTLKDLIEADRYLAAKAAAKTGWGKVKMARAVPPDSTGRC